MKNINFSLALLASLIWQSGLLAQHHQTIPGPEPIPQFLLQQPLADTRMTQYDVKHYFLQIEADNQSTQISGITTVLAEVTDPGIHEMVLELLESYLVSGVKINGSSSSFIHEDDLIVIDLSESYTEGDLITVEVSYSGDAGGSGESFFVGIENNSSSRWGNQVTWTLSEPFNSRSWWPCKQDLLDKADSVWVFITTGSHLKAGSNGILTRTLPLPNNRVRYEWKSSYPIAYYLISIAIADYLEYDIYAYPQQLPGDSILIQNYIYDNTTGTFDEFKDDIDMIPQMLELFSDLFGLYPFHEEKYGHSMAPFSGGMEHQTMTTIGVFQFNLDAHELAHQWFGNYVTCGTWQDIWINEGFARFCEYVALEKLISAEEASTFISGDQKIVLTKPGGSVYVPEESALERSRIFDFRLSYRKGGLILHMIRKMVNNDDLFFPVLTSFLEENKFSTATGEDFKSFLNANTPINFDDFFREWYYGEGYPVYDVVWQNISHNLLIQVDQTTSTETINFFSTPIDFRVVFENGTDTSFRIHPSGNHAEINLPVAGKVAKLIMDPEKWLLKKVETFIQLDENGKVVGLDEHTNPLQVFPNPANTQVHFSKNVEDVRIYNAAGISMDQPVILAGESIDISQVPPGMYILQIRVPHHPHWIQRKILKQ